MRERVKGGGARAPPWARAALGTCVRERRAAAQHGAFGAEPVPGERRSALRGGAFDSGTCEGGAYGCSSLVGIRLREVAA